MYSLPDSIADFWEAYGNSSIYVDIDCPGPTGSLAVDVLNTFGIEVSSYGSYGGNLYGLDIKNMDALSVINLSLLEGLAESGSFFEGTMYEVIADVDGGAKFIEVGGNYASLNDIYYQVQTSSYIEECKGVIIRGGKPQPTWVDTEWAPIWGISGKHVYDNSLFLSNCSNPAFSTHASIVFDDPNLNKTSYKDGINNLYELEDPFEKIMGYATYQHAPGYTKDTRISYNNVANVAIIVCSSDGDGGPYIGNLQERPDINAASQQAFGDEDCWTNAEQSLSISNGIPIPIPESLRYEDIRNTKVDKFQRVVDVFIIGTPLSLCKSAPYNNDAGALNIPPNPDDYTAVIEIDSSSKHVFKLDVGSDYVIIYDKSGEYIEPYILFAKNTRENDPMAYGAKTPYVIGQGGKSGANRQGEEGFATIFPAANNRGYIVEQVIAMIDIDTPSINIYDPEYNTTGEPSKAVDIANDFEYLIRPLVLYEPPATIAFNGDIISQIDGIQDNDPTTQQDFEATPLELVMDQMDGGGGLELTLSFLNNPSEDDTKLQNLSKNLFEFMNHGTGIETNYVCGPNTEVELGEKGPAGGVINNITYSYTDQGSYTISVNEGPRIVKSLAAGGPGGPAIKATESVTARGTVIQNLGNGIHFKVRIDGFGERIAINTCHNIIRKGDVVSCSVYNNPVEV
jgi:hypothetical protein